MIDFESWVIIVLFATVVSIPGWGALVLIRRKTTYSEMDETIRSLSEQVQKLHREIARLQTKVADMTLGMRVLTAQIMALGHAPNYPLDTTVVSDTEPVDSTAIYNRLIREFNVNEMRDLAFRLGIEPDELGEETISGMARALTLYVQRRTELHRLASLMNDVRPRRPHL